MIVGGGEGWGDGFYDLSGCETLGAGSRSLEDAACETSILDPWAMTVSFYGCSDYIPGVSLRECSI